MVRGPVGVAATVRDPHTYQDTHIYADPAAMWSRFELYRHSRGCYRYPGPR